MRVNVTYSVELDEIKQILQEILLKIEDDVEDVSKNFLTAQSNVNSENQNAAIVSIEKCRENLSSIDHSLFDCWNILNGYQKTLVQMKQLKTIEQSVAQAEGVDNNVEGG